MLNWKQLKKYTHIVSQFMIFSQTFDISDEPWFLKFKFS